MNVDHIKQSEELEIQAVKAKYDGLRRVIELRKNCTHDYRDNTAFHDSDTEHVCTKCGNIQINLDSWLALKDG